MGRQPLNQLHQFHQFFNKTNFFVLIEKNCGLMVDELLVAAPQLLRNCPRSATNQLSSLFHQHKLKKFSFVEEREGVGGCCAPCCWLQAALISFTFLFKEEKFTPSISFLGPQPLFPSFFFHRPNHSLIKTKEK